MYGLCRQSNYKFLVSSNSFINCFTLNLICRGKVKVMNYNPDYTEVLETYYGPDEEVFLIEGDNYSYERVRTTFDGSYQFDNLHPGTYQVYIYSEDSTGTVPGGTVAVVDTVEITGNNQVITLPDLIMVD